MSEPTYEIEGPVEEAYKKRMEFMAYELDYILNGEDTGKDRKAGFVLLVFPINEAGKDRCNYISNGCTREDIAILFMEMAALFRNQPSNVGRA